MEQFDYMEARKALRRCKGGDVTTETLMYADIGRPANAQSIAAFLKPLYSSIKPTKKNACFRRELLSYCEYIGGRPYVDSDKSLRRSELAAPELPEKRELSEWNYELIVLLEQEKAQ